MSKEQRIAELKKQLGFVNLRLTFLQEEIVKINKELDIVINGYESMHP